MRRHRRPRRDSARPGSAVWPASGLDARRAWSQVRRGGVLVLAPVVENAGNVADASTACNAAQHEVNSPANRRNRCAARRPRRSPCAGSPRSARGTSGPGRVWAPIGLEEVATTPVGADVVVVGVDDVLLTASIHQRRQEASASACNTSSWSRNRTYSPLRQFNAELVLAAMPPRSLRSAKRTRASRAAYSCSRVGVRPSREPSSAMQSSRWP